MVTKQTEESRTRKEIAKLITEHNPDNCSLPPLTITPYCSNDDRRQWQIYFEHLYTVGTLQRNKKVRIIYNGTPEQALGCDKLRDACESNGLGYEERRDRKYMKDARAIRRMGERLVSIAQRLEELAR